MHRIVDDKVNTCKDQVYVEIHALRGDISTINDRLNDLTGDVHKLGVAVRDIANNSGDIAKSLKGMQEVLTAYRRVRNAWDVFDWLRRNIVTLGFVALVMYYVITSGDAASVAKRLLP